MINKILYSPSSIQGLPRVLSARTTNKQTNQNRPNFMSLPRVVRPRLSRLVFRDGRFEKQIRPRVVLMFAYPFLTVAGVQVRFPRRTGSLYRRGRRGDLAPTRISLRRVRPRIKLRYSGSTISWHDLSRQRCCPRWFTNHLERDSRLASVESVEVV